MPDSRLVLETLIQLHLQGKGAVEAEAQLKSIFAQAKRVSGELGVVDKAGRKAGEGVGFLDKQFRSLGQTVAGYFGARIIANFLKDSYVGFARTERQALATENQIKSLSGAAANGGDSFRQFISDLSLASGILDDDLVPAFQRALLVYNDFAAAQDATRIAAKFAAAGIGNVQENAERLAAVFQTGSTRALKEFGIVTKATAGDTMDVAEAIQLVNERAAALPAGLGDAQQKLDLLRIGWDTLSDAVGKYIEKTLEVAAGPSLVAQIQAVQEARAAAELNTKGDALAKAAIARDTELKKGAAKKAAEDALKEEKRLAGERADLDAKTTQDILSARIGLEEDGSKQRLELELALLDAQKAAAIKAAKEIHATTSELLAIENLYRLLALTKQVQFNRAPKAEDKTPDVLVKLMEWYDAQEKASVEATDRILEIQRDLTEEGTKERMAAELAIELAALDLAENEILGKVAEGDEKRQQIAELYAKKRVKLKKAETDAEIKMDRAKTLALVGSNLQAAAAISGALAALFDDNKAVQYAAAIVNTASAIVAALAQPPGPPTTIPFAIAAGIMGAAQIKTISDTRIGSGGGAPSLSGSGTVGSGAGAVRSRQFGDEAIERISGRVGFHSAGHLVVNVRNLYGDNRSLRNTTRKIQKAARSDAGSIR